MAFPGKVPAEQARRNEGRMSKLLAVAALSGAGLMAGIGTAAEAATSQPVTGVIKGFATAYSSPSNQSAGSATCRRNQADT
jgi:hypothetical protein